MVDVIYTNTYGKEIGILPWCEGDFDTGINNSFELKVPADYPLEQDCYVIVDGTGFGGVIDGIEFDTNEKHYVTISGRTWEGLLATTILSPDSGEDYLTVSGELNAILGQLITRQGLDFCMSASTKSTETTVSSFQFNRYVDAYSGICALLKSKNYKLSVVYDGKLRRVVLSAIPIASYIDDGLDEEQAAFTVRRTRPVNHLKALGEGELKDRIVIDVYADKNRNISTTQTIKGVAHKCETYENTNSDATELLDAAKKKLKELQAEMETVELNDDGSGKYDIGDIVGVVSARNGVNFQTTIAEKIATISDGKLTVETKTESE